MSSEESSAEKKENSGSCEAPTTGKTADGETDSSHDEVQPAIYPLQCNGNKGEAACNMENESKLQLRVGQFNAAKGEAACNLVEESKLELLLGTSYHSSSTLDYSMPSSKDTRMEIKSRHTFCRERTIIATLLQAVYTL
ncbi:hypothetical protein PanWU01x14_311870 [Parasponia andersonii]|uniref:Uncharacterized protein n=1 Tax=Parasponia andersonii TaxID=3476 RepID=A0A2P5APM9_PARAD|nr:hypothetical protein PanWU01x14_311870 [Parasponia andersonii]